MIDAVTKHTPVLMGGVGASNKRGAANLADTLDFGSDTNNMFTHYRTRTKGSVQY